MFLTKIKIPKKPRYLPLTQDADFFSLFKKVRARYETCFLCESLGEHSENSRYAFIGFNPTQTIRARGRALFINDQACEVKNPYLALRDLMPQDCISRRYAGGLFGYLSYEAVNYFGTKVKVKEHPLFDQFFFGVYTDGVVLDTMTRQIYYFYYNENRVEEVKKLLEESVPVEEKAQVLYVGDFMTRSEHADIVEKTKNQILAGNTFQCEVGFKSEYQVQGSPVGIYEQLRQVNPSPYMFYMQYDDVTLLGASPELILQISSGKLKTVPLAGTIKRGNNEQEDVILARQLLNDQKEVAEHVMLVDLARNDAGRVSAVSTVKIENLMSVNKYSHVQHMASTITGILRPGEDMFSALQSLMPGGVLTGAPKLESIKIIDSNEFSARGPYGGAVGYFGFNGDCTFAIPIRSLFAKGSYAFSQTSSGIVYDSLPDKEYQEICNKLSAMRQVLEKFY